MRKMPGIEQADDVARVGLVDGLALLAEEALRPLEADVLAEPVVMHLEVALELARAHAQERDAIAVRRDPCSPAP